MTRRKGEITWSDLQREWPHQVALAAEKVRGLKNGAIVRSFCEHLSVAPLTYALRRDEVLATPSCGGDAGYGLVSIARPQNVSR